VKTSVQASHLWCLHGCTGVSLFIFDIHIYIKHKDLHGYPTRAAVQACSRATHRPARLFC
jgi:hypothetical protein